MTLLAQEKRSLVLENGVTIENIRYFPGRNTVKAVMVSATEAGSKRSEMVINEDGGINPYWKEIFNNFNKEDLDVETEMKKEEELYKKQNKEHQEAEIKAKLFSTKAAVFAIPEVANSTNREIKRRIRRAETNVEAQLLGAALVTMELMNNEKSS